MAEGRSYQGFDRSYSEGEMNMGYQVWHGYSVTRFGNRQRAIDFAYENNGVVIDSWTNAIIPTPSFTRISYWVVSGNAYTDVTASEVQELIAQGISMSDLDLRVSPTN